MPCSCTTGDRFTVTRPNNTSAVYRTLAEANADAARNGGSVVKTS